MLAYALARLCWLPVTLFGIAVATFLLLDLVPLDRAAVEARDRPAAVRAEQVRALRVRYGAVDPVTGAERPVAARFAEWLSRAVRLDLAPAGEDEAAFRARIGRALAVSALLALLALAVALGVGIPLGAWLGARAGSTADRVASAPLLVLSGLPDFLVATLLVLFVGGGLGPALLPAFGLRSPGADAWSTAGQLVDLGAHLVLPVATLAIVPTATITRFLRESVQRSLRSDFVHAMRGFGIGEREVRRRALRGALSPLWTAIGLIVPSLVTGAVVVERVYAIPGFGRLTLDAVAGRDVATTMLATLIAATIVLLGLLASDLLHRAWDPRVEVGG